ncbi:MAG: hypothetical protein P1P90_03615 [Patescibacteria group bacterium]|nr:hypothetical protein [Patescibacteria group bacterium]
MKQLTVKQSSSKLHVEVPMIFSSQDTQNSPNILDLQIGQVLIHDQNQLLAVVIGISISVPNFATEGYDQILVITEKTGPIFLSAYKRKDGKNDFEEYSLLNSKLTAFEIKNLPNSLNTIRSTI